MYIIKYVIPYNYEELSFYSDEIRTNVHVRVSLLYYVPRGVLPEKLGGGVRPTSQNPYPIYDQNLRYSLPYL